jgi:preprotein translocase subunit YajC
MPTASPLFAFLAAKTSTTPKTTGAGVGELVFIVVIFGVLYMFFLRPRTLAARRQRDTLMEINPGDEVLTGAGIFGTVLDVEPDRVTLETAPGTRITVVTEPDSNSVAEQNWHDEGHDGVAEAAGWHDPGEHDVSDHGATGEPTATTDEPEADGAPGTGQGSGR